MSKHRQKVQIVIVCEDNAHAVLVRRYLIGLGYHPKKLRFETNPSGRGAGEQFVRRHYPTELAQYRLRNPDYWRLVVVIDADTGTVRQRETQLAAAAVATGQVPRQPAEGVVHLIPKRNIETWIRALLVDDADEETDYKPAYKNKAENTYCSPAASALMELVRDPNRQPALPSLQLAVGELREKLNGSNS